MVVEHGMLGKCNLIHRPKIGDHFSESRIFKLVGNKLSYFFVFALIYLYFCSFVKKY